MRTHKSVEQRDEEKTTKGRKLQPIIRFELDRIKWLEPVDGNMKTLEKAQERKEEKKKKR